MRLSNGFAAAAAALLGFAGVSFIGGALRPRKSADAHPAATVEPKPAVEAAQSCDRQARLDDLRKIESSLASQIEELTAADATARFLPPRDMPVRFSGPAVRTAVEAAITASGVGGRVDEVDCSAYPCLVVGHYARGDLLGKLQHELARNPDYASDITLVRPMGKDPAGGGTLVGAIVFPRTEPRAAEILAAFKRRRADALTKRVGG
jgi:hypothetical protein